MCGPYFNAFAVAEAQPLTTRAIDAYREAGEQILAANSSVRSRNASLTLSLRVFA